jgi:hypothetical protein
MFAPNSEQCALITPAKRGNGNKRKENSKTTAHPQVLKPR